jgi:hypothetical protein
LEVGRAINSPRHANQHLTECRVDPNSEVAAQDWRYYSGEQIKVGEECGTQGREEECIQGFGRKSELQRQFGRNRCRWEGNSETDFTETRWVGVNWINLAQDRENPRAVANTVMNPRVPKNAGSCLTS